MWPIKIANLATLLGKLTVFAPLPFPLPQHYCQPCFQGQVVARAREEVAGIKAKLADAEEELSEVRAEFEVREKKTNDCPTNIGIARGTLTLGGGTSGG